MGICYVIGAMAETVAIKKEKEDMVIAADGGYAALGSLKAELVVGDFDSLGFVPEVGQTVCYPVEKDDTDMMLAVKYGLEKGYRSFALYGGIGGRLSHTIANIQTLAYLLAHGATGRLCSDTADIYMIGEPDEDAEGQAERTGIAEGQTVNKMQFAAGVEGILSVFAYGGDAHGVTVKGAKYELTDADLQSVFPLGVSNSFVGQAVTVSVKRGRLLIVHEKSASK